MLEPAAHAAAQPSVDLVAVAHHLVESWNREDARAFAALFTPAAEYVTTAGERLAGRYAISQLIGMRKPVIQIRLVGQPLCSAGRMSFAWVAVEPGKARSGRITCACVPRDSGWLIEALHNDMD
jgi:uncharacterized protein (TIGR02246 family)